MSYRNEHNDDRWDSAFRVREVAAAYAAADRELEAERLKELGELTRSELGERFLQLLDLGCLSLPRDVAEWESFERQPRELVVFQSQSMKLHAKGRKELE